MKMGAAPFLVFLFLVTYVYSARDISMPTPRAVQGNQPCMNDGFDIRELVTIFNNEIASLEDSSTKFSHFCSEISRKAQEMVDDQSLIDELDGLANKFCHIPPSELKAKLQANDTCTTCRSVLDNVTMQLENTDKKLLLVVYFTKMCDIQMLMPSDQCKQWVFAVGPLVLGAIQKIASMDLCYKVHICSDPKNKTENGTSWHAGRAYFWSEPVMLNLK